MTSAFRRATTNTRKAKKERYKDTFIKQVSIFVENKPGTLVSITDAIGAAGVDIRAMSIADTQDFGILRLIVSDAEKTKQAVREIGCVVSRSPSSSRSRSPTVRVRSTT